jgi:hypothetical protein
VECNNFGVFSSLGKTPSLAARMHFQAQPETL